MQRRAIAVTQKVDLFLEPDQKDRDEEIANLFLAMTFDCAQIVKSRILPIPQSGSWTVKTLFWPMSDLTRKQQGNHNG